MYDITFENTFERHRENIYFEVYDVKVPAPRFTPNSTCHPPQVKTLHETYPAEGGLATYIGRAKELLVASQVRQ